MIAFLIIIWGVLMLLAVAIDAAVLINHFLSSARDSPKERRQRLLFNSLWLIPLNLPLLLWLLILVNARCTP